MLIDGSNAFEQTDYKLRSKKEATFGWRSSVVWRRKPANLCDAIVDLINKISTVHNVNVVEFKMDYFFKENYIYFR